MYNRYIPQPDGSYRRNRVPEANRPVPPRPTPQKPAPPPAKPECPPPKPEPRPCSKPKKEEPIGGFLRQRFNVGKKLRCVALDLSLAHRFVFSRARSVTVNGAHGHNKHNHTSCNGKQTAQRKNQVLVFSALVLISHCAHRLSLCRQGFCLSFPLQGALPFPLPFQKRVRGARQA